jgi:hypothetical protein
MLYQEMWWALVIALLLASPAGAEVLVSIQPMIGKPDSVLLRITLKGSIARKDFGDLDGLVQGFDEKMKGKWSAIVELDSTGGNIDAALDIGRLLRQREFPAIVDRGAQCLSACVYVLAGAPRRVVNQYGTVGIHRPYDPNDQADTPEQQKAKQTRWAASIKQFLASVNVPARLYEDSLFIPPDRMKVLSGSELQQYGLNANDPYVDEADEIREAKRLGLSRQELGRRKAEARVKCGLDRMNDDTPVPQLRAAAKCEDDYVRRR